MEKTAEGKKIINLIKVSNTYLYKDFEGNTHRFRQRAIGFIIK